MKECIKDISFSQLGYDLEDLLVSLIKRVRARER